MSSVIKNFKPVNRHITILPHFAKKESESGVLLPEDFVQNKEEHLLATVLDVSCDCSSPFQRLRLTGEVHQVVVDANMIKKVDVKDKSHYLILENYVVGIIGRLNAH
tara:strand:- start:509 stop:829 length:321 start_codon:yes stop_codon:yes gene_type:complete